MRITRGTFESPHVRLVALALLLFAIGAGWGTPYATGPDRVKAWGIDDESPLGPLTEIHNILYPKSDQWLSYPLLYSFVTAAFDAPYMLYLVMTGGISGISGTFPYGFKDPVSSLRVLTLIAHLVSSLMAAIAVGAVFDIGNTLGGRRTGLVYAFMAMLSFPLIYYARTGNVDATAVAFVTLALAAFCRIAVSGFTRALALSFGTFVGLALAAKESSVGLFLAMPFLLALWQLRPAIVPAPSQSRASFWKSAALGALAALLAFGLGSGLFVDPKRYFAHIDYLRSLLAVVSSNATAAAYTYPYSLTGHVGYLSATWNNMVDAMGVPVLLAAACGLVFATARRRLLLIPGLMAFVYLAYLLTTYRLVQVRYLMPVILVLLLYAAHATASALDSRAVGWRIAGFGALVLTVGDGALTAIELTYQMLNDSRYAAAQWIAERTKPGDRVEFFGAQSVLPAFEAGVVSNPAAQPMGMYRKPRVDDQHVAEILNGWRERRPNFVLVMPDHTNRQPTPYPHWMPPQLYDGMMSRQVGYYLVATFKTPPLFPWHRLPLLDYPSVNPPIRIFAPDHPAVGSGSKSE